MSNQQYLNFIEGRFCVAKSEMFLDKFDPHLGMRQSVLSQSSEKDVNNAVQAGWRAFDGWSRTSPVKRGQLIRHVVSLMEDKSDELADLVAAETGKPPADAKGEVGGAILQGDFWAGEGMRLYGRSLGSGMDGKIAFTMRRPHGVAGLIVPANTPIANIAWKIFPALVAGNSVVLKASELAPGVANKMAEILDLAGIPPGVFNVIHGDREAGEALVSHPDVPLISFTGSTKAGVSINKSAAAQLKRVSLELGGKNCFVVSNDAHIPSAVHWAALSSFSNAGQRCASSSRVLISSRVYHEFVELLVEKTMALRLGVSDGCDLGPLLSKRQHDAALGLLEDTIRSGGRAICGEGISNSGYPASGYYFYPTILENAPESCKFHSEEAFAPLISISQFDDLDHAIKTINSSKYGLTSSLHTTNIDTAMRFAKEVRTGVVNINLGTYGSEPHMPFGGFGMSGNGTREPGIEALEVYTELSNISFLERPSLRPRG